MREVEVSRLTDVIEKLCIEANEHLPEDVKCAIKTCRACEDGEIAKGILDNIIENFDIADNENVPICQDLSVETGGTLVTAMPGERDGKGNGIIGNVEIKTNGGKIEEVENAKVVKKEDGSITVTGDLVGIKQDGHSYELTATVEPTCTTPGKRVYTCTTHVGETYEETIDALGHHFTERMEVVAPTYTSEGYTIYKCANCGETEKREFVPMLVPESNGGSSAVTLTVTGAGAYETSIADGRYIIAVPAETAVLSGCLGNLRELKARDVTTIVFRTQLRETALNIDSMLSLGVDDTLFTLTHSGESAELTVGGVAHNELLH